MRERDTAEKHTTSTVIEGGRTELTPLNVKKSKFIADDGKGARWTKEHGERRGNSYRLS